MSDYRFDRFVRACFQLQKEKKWLEVQVRIELQNWRLRAKKGESSAECRHRISECLKMFKCVQETQDALIEKEKSRINSYGSDIGEDAVRNLKARLKFFSVLNEQHEALLEMVRRDVQDCRAICRKVGDEDSQIRYRLCNFKSF